MAPGAWRPLHTAYIVFILKQNILPSSSWRAKVHPHLYKLSIPRRPLPPSSVRVSHSIRTYFERVLLLQDICNGRGGGGLVEQFRVVTLYNGLRARWTNKSVQKTIGARALLSLSLSFSAHKLNAILTRVPLEMQYVDIQFRTPNDRNLRRDSPTAGRSGVRAEREQRRVSQNTVDPPGTQHASAYA